MPHAWTDWRNGWNSDVQCCAIQNHQDPVIMIAQVAAKMWPVKVGGLQKNLAS